MAFAKKMMGFPVRIWSHFRIKPNCRQKDLRKYKVSHFLQGYFFYYYFNYLHQSLFTNRFVFNKVEYIIAHSFWHLYIQTAIILVLMP